MRRLFGDSEFTSWFSAKLGGLSNGFDSKELLRKVIENRKPVIDKDLTVGGKINGNQDGEIFMDVPFFIRGSCSF